MTKTKVLATPRSTNTKNKPILKKHNMDNKISIKKISNEKEIVAEFPLMYILHNSVPIHQATKLCQCQSLEKINSILPLVSLLLMNSLMSIESNIKFYNNTE